MRKGSLKELSGSGSGSGYGDGYGDGDGDWLKAGVEIDEGIK